MEHPLILSGGWMAAGWTMIHFLWVGGVIGIFTAFGCLLLRRTASQVRYLFLLGALLALAAAPPAIGWKMLSEGGGTENRAMASPRRGGEGPRAAEVGKTAPRSIQPPAPAGGEGTGQGALPAPGEESPLFLGFHRLALYLPWLWVFGAPFTSTWLLLGLSGAGRLRRRSLPPEDPALLDLFRRLQASLGLAGRVGLGVCERLASPAVLGILRPLVLLPPAALTGCTIEQLEMVLLHELSHVKRLDNLVNFLQRILESVLFFHPVVWWVSARARLEREAACDESVVARTGKPLAYAEVIAGFALSDGLPPAAAALSGKQTVKRLRRILEPKGRTLKFSRPLVAALAAIFLVPLAGFALLLSPPEEGALSPFAFLRFVDHGAGQGSLETAVAVYGGPDGAEVTLVAELPYAKRDYYDQVAARFEESGAVLQDPGTSGPTTGAERIREVSSRIQDQLATTLFGVEAETSAFDRSDGNFIDAFEEPLPEPAEPPEGEEVEAAPAPGDLRLLLGWVQNDLYAFSLYAKKRWSWLFDDEEEPGPRLPILEAEGRTVTGVGGVEFLLGREWVCLWEAAWPAARPETGIETLETRSNRAIISRLDELLSSGRKKVALYFHPGRLSELEALLSRRPGFNKVRKDWLPVWRN